MISLLWSPDAWEEYLSWQKEDKKKLKKDKYHYQGYSTQRNPRYRKVRKVTWQSYGVV